MEGGQFIAGLAAGLFLVLFLFSLSDSMRCEDELESCEETKDCSACEKNLDAARSMTDLQQETFTSFTDYLFTIDNPQDYLSHLKPCIKPDNRTAQDQCVLDFVLETKEYRACALLTNTEIMRSCLAMENSSSEQ